MDQDFITSMYKRSPRTPFVQLLGIEALHIEPGLARAAMTYEPKMTNMHGFMHGGALFSLLDEVFGLACNAHGTVGVALQLSVYYLSPPAHGERIIAQAKEVNRTRKTALYEVTAWQEGTEKQLARAEALAYLMGKPQPWDESGDLPE